MVADDELCILPMAFAIIDARWHHRCRACNNDYHGAEYQSLEGMQIASLKIMIYDCVL